MTDTEFMQKFTDHTLPKSEFTHQAHLRVAWYYLTHHKFETAADLIAAEIKKYATAIGASHIFHETLTYAWTLVVADAIKNNPTTHDFATFFVAAKAELTNKDAPLRFYSKEMLASLQAKQTRLPMV